MAAHRVPEDAAALEIGREAQADELAFAGDVAFHPPVAGPGLAGGVEIEACADAEIPGVGLAGDARVAGLVSGATSISPSSAASSLGAGLDGEGLLGAGEAGEIEQHRHRPLAARGGTKTEKRIASPISRDWWR